MNKEHIYSVDICRAIFMFFIVVQHMSGFAGHNVAWLTNASDFGVAGFVFISGWFGITLHIAKVFKLWLTALYCAIVVHLMRQGSFLSLHAFLEILYGWWFLNAYTILCLLSPILNFGIEKSVEKGSERLVIIPTALLLFGWIYATTIARIEWLIPKPSGIVTTSAITLVCIYVLSRYVRVFYDRLIIRINRMFAIILSLVCVGVNAIGLGSFASLPAFLLVVTIFSLINDCKISRYVGKCFKLLTPSLFSVYMLHVVFAFSDRAKIFEDCVLAYGLPVVPMVFFCSCVVFTVCVAIDGPRRLFVLILENAIRAVKSRGFK